MEELAFTLYFVGPGQPSPEDGRIDLAVTGMSAARSFLSGPAVVWDM